MAAGNVLCCLGRNTIDHFNLEFQNSIDMQQKESLVQSAINTVRVLAADAVQKANSGHPGMPMGAAPMAHVLWSEAMNYNAKNPDWLNRDRFILSAGHGCMVINFRSIY